VLEVRWTICAHEKQWRDALEIAEQELKFAPDESSGWLHRAYALRRVSGGGLSQAWNALLPAAEKFPAEPVIAYNLSCYACQLQQLDIARHWLNRAVRRQKGRHQADGAGRRRFAAALGRDQEFVKDLKTILSVDGLRIERGCTTILNNVNWRVNAGEHWVILGANGSGKTSLLSRSPAT